MAKLIERIQATQHIIENIKKVIALQLEDPKCGQSTIYKEHLNRTLSRAKMDTIIGKLKEYEELLMGKDANTEAVENDSHALMQPLKELFTYAEQQIKEIRSLPRAVEILKAQLLSLFNVFHNNIDSFFTPQAMDRGRHVSAGAYLPMGKQFGSFHAPKPTLDAHQKKIVKEAMSLVDSLSQLIRLYSKQYSGSGFHTLMNKYYVDFAALNSSIGSLEDEKSDLTQILKGLNQTITKTLAPLENALTAYASGKDNHNIPPGCATEAQKVARDIDMLVKKIEELKPTAPSQSFQFK